LAKPVEIRHLYRLLCFLGFHDLEPPALPNPVKLIRKIQNGIAHFQVFLVTALHGAEVISQLAGYALIDLPP
jgi:hypothetical protein